MLPRAEIWQGLRTEALSAVPAGTTLRLGEPATVANWLSLGSYTATRPSRNRIVLDASAQEVGAAFLGDASLYLDASLEHAYSLRYAFRSESWSSDGWALVAAYYWAFYLVTAWDRLLGGTTLFLDDTRTQNLVALSGGQSVAPGTYRMNVKSSSDAGRVLVEIRKAGASRVHDASWRHWTETLRARVRQSREDGGARDERDYYEALLKPFNVLGDAWPSDLRNAANYAPVFGYRAVRRASSAFDLGILRAESIAGFDDCLGRLRQNGNVLVRADVRDQSRLVTRILLDFTYLLHVSFVEMYREVLERRGIDRRWSNLRDRFVSEVGAVFPSANWPLDNV